MFSRIIPIGALSIVSLLTMSTPSAALEPSELTVSASASYQRFSHFMTTRSERVSYADLNIGNAAGAKALLARIGAAADRVCGPDPGIRDLVGISRYYSCRQESETGAVSALNHPTVTAFYNSKHAHTWPQGTTAAMPK